MEIESRKNKYNHEVVDCPFCAYFAYVPEINKKSDDPLRGLKRHITVQAKNEALIIYFDPKADAFHLRYFKEHTSERRVVTKAIKRQYDDNLELKHG